MATIKDVARLAGVSVATVSRVINNSPKASEASRLAVHSAMESLSYHPNANARALAQQTTETGGLIVGVRVVLSVLLPVLRRGVVLPICA